MRMPVGQTNVLQAFRLPHYLGAAKNLRYDSDPSQELGIPEENFARGLRKCQAP